MFSVSDVHRIFREEMPEGWTETVVSKMSGGKAYHLSTQENRTYNTNEKDVYGRQKRFFVFVTKHSGLNATTDEIVYIIQIKVAFEFHVIEKFIIMDLNPVIPTKNEESTLRHHIKEMVGQFIS